MDSSNLAVAASLTKATASVKGYRRVASTLPWRAFCFLVNLAMLHTLHNHTHGTSRASQRTHGSIHVGSGHILELGLGNFFQLLTGDLANLGLQRVCRTLFQLGSLLDQHDSRRRLDDEGEA